MIAAPFDRRATAAVGGALPGFDPVVVPLLARLLVGEPLDRDQRGVIVGEVLRLWAIEERLDERPAERTAERPTAAVTAPRAPSR